MPPLPPKAVQPPSAVASTPSAVAPPPAPSGTLPGASQVYPPPPTPVAPTPPAPGAAAPPAGYPPPSGYAYWGYPYPPSLGAYRPYAPAPLIPGRHQHDGFFLRMNFGFGASAFKTDYAGSTTEISGRGLDFAIALGGAATRHLILYGEICETGTFNNPTSKVNGQNRDASYSDVIFVSIGAGAAYYFGDSNYVLSGSLSIAALTFEGLDIQRSQNSTDRGLSLRALFGKEWWVSSNWGMGAALALTLSAIRDRHLEAATANGGTATWSAGAISLLFSATYN